MRIDPKVGEVWELKSGHTWDDVVLVLEVDRALIRCAMLDTVEGIPSGGLEEVYVQVFRQPGSRRLA